MCLTEPKTPRGTRVHPETIDVDCHADRGADATTARYQIANPRRHISLHVFLRLAAMDVCCGPPAPEPAFLIADLI
jgi:hypothetical protein